MTRIPTARKGRRLLMVVATTVGTVSLGACGSSKQNAGGGAVPAAGGGSVAGAGSASFPTIPPPAKVTGTLSGPGVTASTITIGEITTTSGPVPGLFQGANDGLDAWAKWVNANGGIAGHTVVISHADDGFDCTTYTNAMKRYSTSAFAVLGNLTLEDTCGKAVLAANPSMIDIQALALDPTLYSVANAWTASPSPPGGTTTGWQYLKRRFPDDITHTAALVGASAALNGKEIQLTASSIGYKYVYTRNIGDFETNYTSDILRMKNAGVKIVDLTATAAPNVADFLQQAHQQGFHPDAVVAASGYDARLFKLLGRASLADNVLFAPLPDAMYLGQDAATVPAVNTFLLWLDKARPGAAANLFAVDAWSAGMLFDQAAQNAGGTVTPSTVSAALAKITNFDAGGLLAPTDPGQKQGTRCVVIAGVEGGQWKRIEPSSGFDCSGTYFNVALSQLK